MARMVRKQVYLEREQDEFLKRRSAELGVSEAELIRRFIEKCSSDTAGEDLVRRGRSRAARLLAWEELKELMEPFTAPAGARREDRGWTRDELYDD